MAVRKKQSLVFFDAPCALIFSMVSLLIFLLSRELLPSLNAFFSAPGAQGSAVAFDWLNPLQYARLLFHVLGNTSWSVFASDLAFILLLGPQLEQRFGSLVIALMMTVTALVSGILNAAFSSSLLMGATGIAFMMILLAAFTTIDKAAIPLSFFCAAVLFLFRELYYAIDTASLSNFAHLAGGLAGSSLGFTAKIPQPAKRKPRAASSVKPTPQKKGTEQDLKAPSGKSPQTGNSAQKNIQSSNSLQKKDQWEDVSTLKM